MANSNPDDRNRIDPDLLRLIPRNARIVVEVGSGAGTMGGWYGRLNPDARCLGITPGLSDELPLAPGEAVDCFVYGDVLERSADPWALIRRHAGRLAADGVMLACVTNLQHWSLVRRLLDGSWRYEDEGLLDRDRLRWFTLDTMRELFEGAGLVIHDALPRVPDKPAADRFVAALTPALEALRIDPRRFAERAAALQFVIRAGRRREERRLLVQAMTLRPQAGMNDVRILQPLNALATRPEIRVTVQEGTATLAPAGGAEDKVFIWQRPILSPEAVKGQVRALTERGYVVVTEFDDHPMRWPNIEKWGHLSFRGVHAVQTSTEPLAEMFRTWNPEVAVFPNAVAELPPRAARPAGAPARVFFGALNREADWAPILPSLNAAIGVLGDTVEFEVVHDRGFFDALATPRKRFTPTCDYARYRQLLAGCDIALLPLADTEFNRMKSDLKFIEAAASGAAVLASPTVYAASVADGETGLLCFKPEEFGDRLRLVVEDAGLRRSLADRAYAYVRTRRMQAQQMGVRLAWYRKLAATREELLRSWRERIATL